MSIYSDIAKTLTDEALYYKYDSDDVKNILKAVRDKHSNYLRMFVSESYRKYVLAVLTTESFTRLSGSFEQKLNRIIKNIV